MEYDDYASTPSGKTFTCAYPGCGVSDQRRRIHLRRRLRADLPAV